MKILILTPWYPDDRRPNHGLFVQDLALALSVTHQVTVISSKIDYSGGRFFSFHINETNLRSLKEHRLVIRKSWPVYNQFNFFLITIWYTLKIARSLKPDIIHGHVGYPTAFWGWVVSKLIGLPLVITEHTRLENNFRSWMHKKLTLFGLRRASQLVAVSHFLARQITAMVGRPVKVVPNVVDIQRFQDARPSTEAVPQIGFLGGLSTNVKGLDMLIKAVAQLQLPFALHIGGDGVLIDDYKKLARDSGIENNCRFYGSIAPHDVPAFMSKLHFFVCSSRFETFGVALVEAMASGLPVVATRCGGPEELVTPKTGVLATLSDISDLHAKIEWMIANAGEFNDVELRAQASFFAGAPVVKLMDGVYHALLGFNASSHEALI